MKYVLRRYIMKMSTVIKGGIALSAVCAAALSIDNAKLSKKNRQLEQELEQAKSSPAPQPAPESTRVYDDPEDQIEADFYNRAFELESRMLDLAERKIVQAEEAEARKEARRASKEAAKAAKAQAKAERKAARKASKV